MTTKKAYMELVNKFMQQEYDEIKMELLVNVEGYADLKNGKIDLVDVYHKDVKTAMESKEDRIFSSITHVFSFNNERTELEWIDFEFPHMLFNNNTHEIVSSRGETDIYENEQEGIAKSTILEDMLAHMDVANFIECQYEFHGQLLNEDKEGKLISLEDARLLFANIVKVEVISLKKTRMFISEDVYFTFDNIELKNALKKLKN